jgi:hypothetical protein
MAKKKSTAKKLTKTQLKKVRGGSCGATATIKKCDLKGAAATNACPHHTGV